MKRVSVLLVLLVALAAAAWAVPKIKSVKIFRDQGGAAGAEVPYFKPSDRVQHFLFELDGIRFGKLSARVVFTGVNTTAGDNVQIQEVSPEGLVANQISAELSLPRDWPVGSYKADLYLGGNLAESFPYVVSPSVDELTYVGHHLYRDNGSGEEGPEVTAFAPSDHKLHFSVITDGFFMGNNEVEWSYIALNTSEGQNQAITSAKTTLNDLKGNTLTGEVELPRDWPTGTYRVEVAVNGKKAYQFDYEVKP